VASLSSILILGSDTVAAAHPATPAQLVHACHRWGFAAVVPASWGDELIATEVIRRCTDRPTRPVVQCSCPHVADRLGPHASILDDAVFWLVSPPVAVAKYLRSMDATREIHLTYAGDCPGAVDASIDERISPRDLLAALGARGIDPLAQPTVFEDIVPADRRRHASSPGGIPELHRLWEIATFRVAQPSAENLTVSVAQLLLTEDRLLIDCAADLGCVCRSTKDAGSETSLVRSPSPIISSAAIDLDRPAPVPAPAARPASAPSATTENPETLPDEAPRRPSPRHSPSRPAYRRQSMWRRQSPRPGMIVARTSGVLLAVNESRPWMKRDEARWLITAIIAAAALILGVWAGRHTAPPRGAVGTTDPYRPAFASAVRAPSIAFVASPKRRARSSISRATSSRSSARSASLIDGRGMFA
jgi:hypothetical protein